MENQFIQELLSLVNEKVSLSDTPLQLENDIDYLIHYVDYLNMSSFDGKNVDSLIDISSYANINDFISHVLNQKESTGFFDKEATEGDIIVKDGNYLVSFIPNGSHFIVKKSGMNTLFLSTNGDFDTLSFPEEYRVVGNIDEKLNNYLNELD